MTLKSKLISLALGVLVTLPSAAFSQSARTVMVQSNTGVLLFPTNLWAANAVAARAGLGLGSLAQSNTIAIANVTGLQGALDAKLATNPVLSVSNVAGLQSALDGKLSPSSSLAISNITGLQGVLDSKLGTNGTLQISNIANLQSTLDNLNTGGVALSITNIDGLQSALDSKLSADSSVSFSNISGLQSVLDGKVGFNTTNGEVTANTGTNPLTFTNTVRLIGGGPSQYSVLFGDTNSAVALPAGIYYTNYSLAIANNGNILTIGNGSGGMVSGNFSGSLTVSSAGSISFSGGANIGLTRTNLGLGATWLTNTDVTNFRTAIGLGSTNTVRFASGSETQVGIGVGSTNTGLASGGLTMQGRLGLVHDGNIIAIFSENNPHFGLYRPMTFQGTNASFNASTTRTNLGLGATWLTNTTTSGFRSAIGLGDWATLSDGGSLRSSTLTISDGESPDYIEFTDGTGVTFYGNRASQFRTALGLGATWLTNTNSSSFRSGIGFSSLLSSLWTSTNADSARGALGLATTSSVTFGTVIAGTAQARISSSSSGGIDFGYQGNSIRATLSPSTGFVLFESGHSYGFGLNNTNGAAITRTNLGLGATWLTNTDATNFRTAIGLGATNTVSFGGLGVGSIDVVGQAIINGELLLEEGATISFGDGKAATRTNLGLGATWLTNTDVTNFRTAIGLGATWLTNTDAAGVRSDLGFSDALWAFKSANQTNNTTNFVSDTVLTFTAEANTTYLVSGAIGFVSILVSTNQQTGMDGKFLVPTNATVFGSPPYYSGSLNDNRLGLASSYTSSFALVEEHDGAAYLPFQFILTTGNDSGAVTFQFKPSGANTHAVVGQGSYLRAEVVTP